MILVIADTYEQAMMDFERPALESGRITQKLGRGWRMVKNVSDVHGCDPQYDEVVILPGWWMSKSLRERIEIEDTLEYLRYRGFDV